MKKANELRIGNRVWFEDDDLCMTTEGVVEYIKTDGVYTGGDRVGEKIYMVGLIGRNGKEFLEHIIDLHPIPLTPEILEKAGFRDDSITHHIGPIMLVESENGFTAWYKHFGESNRILIDINYVHQLQNIYFALTGEELEINLT